MIRPSNCYQGTFSSHCVSGSSIIQPVGEYFWTTEKPRCVWRHFLGGIHLRRVSHINTVVRSIGRIVMVFPPIIRRYDHHRLQGLSLLACSALKSQAIFLASLCHVFLSVNNTKVTWDLFLVASPVYFPATLCHIKLIPANSLLKVCNLNISFHFLHKRNTPGIVCDTNCK
jgi:hypothetical protein